ncbi:type IV pilus biogenesis protein PilM [Paraburkholderia sediminicola]|uniref:type IV pilus biogenesis protein PilM n=1 Tax=Paraburkholderia TaxID=1822464 RepID=UPI0038B90381
MTALWMVFAIACITGVYALVDANYMQATPTMVSVTTAQSMSAYRQALVAYALANPTFVGAVSAAALQPYLSAGTTSGSWLNYVVPNTSSAGSLVVVYTTSASAAAALTGIEQLSGGSALAGVALNGTVLSPGNPAVPLPTAIAAVVPNGTPVWMAQAYQP